MKTIPLSKGKFAIVDDGGFDKLNKHKWYAQKTRNYFYAARAIGKFKNQKIIFMHREIMGLTFGDEKQIDHKNGNTLDNRCCNLRNCTPSQNSHNSDKRQGGLNNYKGITSRRQGKKWQSRICVNGKRISLGYFSTEIEAAQAYNKKAIELLGDFAFVNRKELNAKRV